MDKDKVLETLKVVRENSRKRNFNQTFDLIINFKELDLKKKNVDVFLNLPYPSRNIRVCGIVGEELGKKAKESCDEVILENELKKYSDKRLVKKLAKNCDFFIAQANLMGQIASIFGRVLGPLGKMPNPSLGGVLVPNAEVRPVVDKFKKSLRLMTKKEPIIKCAIGKEDMKDEEIIENFSTIYDHIVHDLPKGEHNVKSVLIKLTMGKPVKVGEKIKIEEKIEIKEGKEKEKIPKKKIVVKGQPSLKEPFKKSFTKKENVDKEKKVKVENKK